MRFYRVHSPLLLYLSLCCCCSYICFVPGRLVIHLRADSTVTLRLFISRVFDAVVVIRYILFPSALTFLSGAAADGILCLYVRWKRP